MISNPYSLTPLSERGHFNLHPKQSDLNLVKSIFPEKGALTSLIHTYVKHLADQIRTHNLTYLDRPGIDERLHSGLPDLEPNRVDGGSDERGSVDSAHTEVERGEVDKSTAEVVEPKKVSGRDKGNKTKAKRKRG